MNPDYLPLIAEIGMALAGFGGVVGLIGRQGSSESPEIDAARLRGMLERAVAIVLFALLPLALGQFTLADSTIWRACSLALLVIAPGMYWRQFLRLRRFPDHKPGRLWMVAGQINQTIEVIVLSVALLGYLPLPAAYGVVLMIEIYIASSQFLRVVASITAARD